MNLKGKYDTEDKWTDNCIVCEKPVTLSNAWMEVVGCYHSGCFGYPVCVCEEAHLGDCHNIAHKDIGLL